MPIDYQDQEIEFDGGITNEFIYDVINAAGKKFVGGYVNTQNFERVLSELPTENAEHYHVLKRNIIKKQDKYLSYANSMPNSNLIAAPGFISEKYLEILLKDTVFNEKPIHQIVCFAKRLAYDDNNKFQDFYDYCLKERKIECGRYNVEVKRISGITLETYDRGKRTIPLSDLVCSELIVKNSSCTPDTPDEKTSERKLNVTLFKLRDGAAINLDKDKDNTIREAIWQLYQKSLKESIWIHCAAGIGRTGHIILTLLILKNYYSIFVGNDIQASKDKILKLLADIREERSSLVSTNEQFWRAIYNAHLIHRYALEKKYIQAMSKEDMDSPRASSICDSLSQLFFINPSCQYKTVDSDNDKQIDKKESDCSCTLF